MANFYRELVAILRANKFRQIRPGRGSHEIWQNDETGKAF